MGESMMTATCSKLIPTVSLQCSQQFASGDPWQLRQLAPRSMILPWKEAKRARGLERGGDQPGRRHGSYGVGTV